MTILVTGGGGFVMSNLVKRWLTDHPTEHAIVVDTLAFDANLQRFFGALSSRIDWHVGDVVDQSLWQRLSSNTDVNYLVHGAAATSMLRHVHADGPGKPGLAGSRDGNCSQHRWNPQCAPVCGRVASARTLGARELWLGIRRARPNAQATVRTRASNARGTLWDLEVCR